jgi:hypothetical protein
MNVVKIGLGLTSLALAAWLIRSRLRPKQPGEVVKSVYQPLTKWAAQRALAGRNRSRQEPEKGRFTKTEVNRILEEVWLKYDELAPTLPHEPTVGSRMNVKLACLTLAFFNSLLATGIERGYAVELISDVTWKVYKQWGVLGRFLAQLLPFLPSQTSRGPNLQQVENDGAVSLLFPFNAPGYIVQAVAMKSAIAFNIVRCPVAEYFHMHGAADLCVGSWCNLDYALAEMQGYELIRSKTLAEGDDCCDFRFTGGRKAFSFVRLNDI